MTSKSFDAIALDILLQTNITEGQRGKKLDALLKQAAREYGIVAECPTCGSVTAETNGASGGDLTYLCQNGHAFDAVSS